MSGRNRQRYSQHNDRTLKSHEDFTRSSLIQRIDPPIYFHRPPELEAERRVYTTTLSSRYTSSPGRILLAPNKHEFVYKAIVQEKCFERRKLGEPDVAYKGLCILNHKTACANYKIEQRDPYVCWGISTFEIRWADSNWCFGEGCLGLLDYETLGMKLPFCDWHYQLELYYGRDDRELAVERNNIW
ncbi:hypothetical protein OCU04_006166 [Sclerotinia nivalis]|uniref:Uncharacterized protein n=1 Tax=Sclerotinia nivalis TaxID=352851 RepID=A0A9X0AMP3_9HELO|nr:hypothetical protein OCU04_006166 [Sclerotinia nivalis]